MAAAGDRVLVADLHAVLGAEADHVDPVLVVGREDLAALRGLLRAACEGRVRLEDRLELELRAVELLLVVGELRLGVLEGGLGVLEVELGLVLALGRRRRLLLGGLHLLEGLLPLVLERVHHVAGALDSRLGHLERLRGVLVRK